MEVYGISAGVGPLVYSRSTQDAPAFTGNDEVEEPPICPAVCNQTKSLRMMAENLETMPYSELYSVKVHVEPQW